jgi:hypothetical protein
MRTSELHPHFVVKVVRMIKSLNFDHIVANTFKANRKGLIITCNCKYNGKSYN